MLPIGLTIFIGAFLLFGVQPMVASTILPWLGGTPSVWSTSMLFFQSVLLAGYGYAHLLAGRKRIEQSRFHLLVLGGTVAQVALLWALWKVPILPTRSLFGSLSLNPSLVVLFLLLVSVGLPFFLLASTGPLLQSWSTVVRPGRSPYRLYALSNAGSLLALLSYPFLIEPFLPLGVQAKGWAVLFLVFSLLCALCARKIGRITSGVIQHDPAMEEGAPALATASGGGANKEGAPLPAALASPAPVPDAPAPRSEGDGSGPMMTATWIGLACAACILLLAITNQMTLEIAVVPFLWVVPLTLYLLSFILCFERPIWYQRWLWVGSFSLMMGYMMVLRPSMSSMGIGHQIILYSVTLLVGCMVCHGELYRLKPAARHLTRFYLSISVGGALGGALVSIGFPLITKTYWEYPLSVLGCAIVAALAVWRYRPGPWTPNGIVWAARTAALCILALGLFFPVSHVLSQAPVDYRDRNFFGTISVASMETRIEDSEGGHVEEIRNVLWHGRTVHGFQYAAPPFSLLPTSYYHRGSAVGEAEAFLRAGVAPRAHSVADEVLVGAGESGGESPGGGLRIGVVGLGVGTVAAYGRRGDVIRFYEINPQVVDLAQGEGGYFTYLQDSMAEVEVVLGDARVSMESELAAGQPQQYDLLVVDAFSSGAIPAHLLTLEAIELYVQHLSNPAGVLTIHISNRFLALDRVVEESAHRLGMVANRYRSGRGDDAIGYSSEWMILVSSPEHMPVPLVVGEGAMDMHQVGERYLWTDDHIRLWQAVSR